MSLDSGRRQFRDGRVRGVVRFVDGLRGYDTGPAPALVLAHVHDPDLALR